MVNDDIWYHMMFSSRMWNLCGVRWIIVFDQQHLGQTKAKCDKWGKLSLSSLLAVSVKVVDKTGL